MNEKERVIKKIEKVLVKYREEGLNQDNVDFKNYAAHDILKIKGLVVLSDDQSRPEYDFTDTPTYFESGYNIAQQDMKDWRRMIINGY